MSKFIDKLVQLTRNEPQPIGFRAIQPTLPKPKMQLVVSLAQEHVESLIGRVVGADAGLLRIFKSGKGAETIQKISQIIPDIPWGGWLQNGAQEAIERMDKAGCDFIVFPAATTPLETIENAAGGNILEIESSTREGLLRASNELPIDAALISIEQKEGRNLTWQDLMLFQYFARLLTKPLLVCVPAKVTGGELKALWEAGVTGVVLEVGSEEPHDVVEKLRQIIDKIEFPVTRRRQRTEPSLLSGTGREQRTAAFEVEEE
jgi:hypothetical protein